MHTLGAAPHKTRGLSLVELLVALAIGTVLTLGVGQIFVAGKQSYTMNDALARVQENGRFAVARLQRELRESGVESDVPQDPANRNVHLPVVGNDLPIFSDDIVIGVDGRDAAHAAQGNSVDSGSTDLVLADFPSDRDTDSDAFTISGVRAIAGGPGNDCQLDSSKNSGEQANIKLKELSSGACPSLSKDQVLLLTDYGKADLFRVNNSAQNTNVNIQYGGWSNSEKIDFDRYYPTDGSGPKLLGLIQTQYYIDTDDACDDSALIRREIPITFDADTETYTADEDHADAQALICGIRTIQVLYGVAESGSRIERHASARDVDFGDDDVLALRAMLLLADERHIGGVDELTSVSFPEAISGAGQETVDWPAEDAEPAVAANRLSKRFSTVIGLRNRQSVF